MVPLQWTDSGWVVEFEANPDETFEYKHIIVTHGGDVVWEGGPNRVLSVPSEGKFEVVTHWDCTHEDLQLQSQEEFISTFAQRWQGGHNTASQWDTTGLDGPALHIVEGDRSGSNWWKKLEVVRTLLSSQEQDDRLKMLVNIAVYLKWINTGLIPCRDDGEHHELNEISETSRQIFVELERLSNVSNLRELVVIRKIHPCLPSFNTELARIQGTFPIQTYYCMMLLL